MRSLRTSPSAVNYCGGTQSAVEYAGPQRSDPAARWPRDRESAQVGTLSCVGHAIEVARAIPWLLSDEASYTTGTFIDVAGGR